MRLEIKDRHHVYSIDGIKVEIERSPVEMCNVTMLKINGIQESIHNIGKMIDLKPELAPPCGCGDRGFVPKDETPTLFFLNKYNITQEQYYSLMGLLEEVLHFGPCKKCK